VVVKENANTNRTSSFPGKNFLIYSSFRIQKYLKL
jgi:hypothetical protein